jgi:hypothetical protein
MIKVAHRIGGIGLRAQQFAQRGRFLAGKLPQRTLRLRVVQLIFPERLAFQGGLQGLPASGRLLTNLSCDHGAHHRRGEAGVAQAGDERGQIGGREVGPHVGVNCRSGGSGGGRR